VTPAGPVHQSLCTIRFCVVPQICLAHERSPTLSTSLRLASASLRATASASSSVRRTEDSSLAREAAACSACADVAVHL